MRFKTIFCAALLFILGTSLAAFCQAIKDGQFEVKNVVKSTEEDVLPTVIVRCPDQQHIGPVSVPNGWQSLGAMPRNRFSISVDIKNRSIVCGYTNDPSGFQYFSIARKIPPGYECAIPFPKDYRAICTTNPRARPKQ